MKSEKDKMLAGELYFAGDDELGRGRIAARKFFTEYNSTEPTENERRLQLLKKTIKFKGDILIEPPFYCDYGFNIEVGENFYANFSCIFLDTNKIIIGNNVMLGPNVQLYTATHPLVAKERITGLELAKPITIGDNVWIGGGAIVCPGITIGDNTTIGAGSVVTKDIPDNKVAAGNPCKIIRNL